MTDIERHLPADFEWRHLQNGQWLSCGIPKPLEASADLGPYGAEIAAEFRAMREELRGYKPGHRFARTERARIMTRLRIHASVLQVVSLDERARNAVVKCPCGENVSLRSLMQHLQPLSKGSGSLQDCVKKRASAWYSERGFLISSGQIYKYLAPELSRELYVLDIGPRPTGNVIYAKAWTVKITRKFTNALQSGLLSGSVSSPIPWLSGAPVKRVSLAPEFMPRVLLPAVLATAARDAELQNALEAASAMAGNDDFTLICAAALAERGWRFVLTPPEGAVEPEIGSPIDARPHSSLIQPATLAGPAALATLVPRAKVIPL